MHALLISLAVFSQAGSDVPPAPIPASPAIAPATSPNAAPASDSVEDMKAWLLGRLIVDLSFDPQKTAEVKGMIDTLTEPQLRVLIAVYKERAGIRDQTQKASLDAKQQQTLDQAKLGLQQAEAYRDHLKREYDQRLLQGYMYQNLNYRNMLYQQAFLNLTYSPYGYGGLGYMPWGFGGGYGGGFGYGGMGTFGGIGMPGYGSSYMYSNPYYWGGVGVW